MKNIFLCSILILAIGCNSTKSKKDAASSTMLEDSAYKVASILGTDVTTENLTFEISEAGQKISGFGGCNNYSGAIMTQENGALFSSVVATKKFCGAMKTEKLFFNEMQNVTAVNAEGTTLNLNNANGDTIIVLNK